MSYPHLAKQLISLEFFILFTWVATVLSSNAFEEDKLEHFVQIETSRSIYVGSIYRV